MTKTTTITLVVIALILIAVICVFPKAAQAIALLQTALIFSFLGVVIIPMFNDGKLNKED